MNAEELRAALARAIGDPARVSTGESKLDLHAGDISFHRPHRPDVVVKAESTAEVSAVLALADEHRVPITPFGAGTSLEGHVIPVAGGISLDLTRMDRIVGVAPENLTATVQAGVTRSALGRAAAPHGLFFPVDPGADATLGGMAATNAAGTTTVRYGKMRQNVLALEAVLADGSVIRAGERSAEDVRRLRPRRPPHRLRGHARRDHRADAAPPRDPRARGRAPDRLPRRRRRRARRCRDRRRRCRGDPRRADRRLDGVRDQRPRRHRPPTGAHALRRGRRSEQSVASDLELVRAVATEEGAEDVVAERDPTARARLWAARHAAAHAAAAAAPGKRPRATDVCVPLSELAATVSLARAEVDRRGLVAGILGHAGDGNVHVALHVDPDDAAELAEADELVDVLITDALARGGTCTGEHGIGLGKRDALEREHPDLLPLMRGIKELFDPHGIMNPGKVLRPASDVGFGH